MKHKILIFSILIGLLTVLSFSTYSKKEKNRLKIKQIIKKEPCQLLKEDLPKSSFLLFDKKVVYSFKIDKFYKFIFGCRQINESSQIYINQHAPNGILLLEKFKNDSIISEVFVDFKDTAVKSISNRYFKDYSYKLSHKEFFLNDTLYVYNFIKNIYSVNRSHTCFLPLKQIFISKSNGISKVVLEDKCFLIIYD